MRAVTWYLEGKASCSQLARQFGVNPCTIKD
ncbi:helix-turn-helix domain-containing protein, partial [Streptococcus sp.]|nr:helix-turn-helix domain-containing protein [Streptococcus sp.]